jgi:hypothetical protein
LGTSVGALKASYHLAVKKIEKYFGETEWKIMIDVKPFFTTLVWPYKQCRVTTLCVGWILSKHRYSEKWKKQTTY